MSMPFKWDMKNTELLLKEIGELALAGLVGFIITAIPFVLLHIPAQYAATIGLIVVPSLKIGLVALKQYLLHQAEQGPIPVPPPVMQPDQTVGVASTMSFTANPIISTAQQPPVTTLPPTPTNNP